MSPAAQFLIFQTDPLAVVRSIVAGYVACDAEYCLGYFTMFEPENDLERSLVKAASDPGHRPQFYRDLLTSAVWFINSGELPLHIENGVIPKGTNVAIQPLRVDGADWIPIFTSNVRAQQHAPAGSTCVQLTALSFFNLVRGNQVILNPHFPYGKEFTAPEVQSLLDGTMFFGGTTKTFEKNTQVLLFQPKAYPTKLVQALSSLFRKHAAVKAAYLVCYFTKDDDRLHTFIAIDADGDVSAIIGDAGSVAVPLMPENQFLEFAGSGSLFQHVAKTTKPFYKQSLLRRLFG